MTIASYSELVSELGTWLNRSDLSANIPSYIKLFESRFNRLMRHPAMEVTADSSTVAGTQAVALPSDCLALRSVYLVTDPVAELEYITPAYLRATYVASTQAQPIAYTIEGQSIVLGPVPDASYTLTIGYYQRVPGLSETNTTNWLLTSYPDAYLYGALAMASAQIADDTHAQQWNAAWEQVMAEMADEANGYRVSGPLQMRSTVTE